MRVRRKEKPIEAVRFTGYNQDEFDTFVGCDGETEIRHGKGGRALQIQITFYCGYVRTLGVGDYLIRNSNDVYDRVNKDVFKRCYEVLE